MDTKDIKFVDNILDKDKMKILFYKRSSYILIFLVVLLIIIYIIFFDFCVPFLIILGTLVAIYLCLYAVLKWYNSL